MTFRCEKLIYRYLREILSTKLIAINRLLSCHN